MEANKSIAVGSLVNCQYTGNGEIYTGVVTDIKETKSLFSEKYAIVETNTTVYVLCSGAIEAFDLEEDTIKVIHED